MSWRATVTSLLILAALLALVTMPSGLSQSLTTILTTVTTQVVVLGTVNSTVGTTKAQSTAFTTEIYSTPFVIQPTGGMYACRFAQLGFTASAGEAIALNVKTSIPISFYIMTASDYQTWVSRNSCDAPSGGLYSKQISGAMYVDMIAPTSGDYDLVFLNFSQSSPANVSLAMTGVSEALTTISVPVVAQIPVTKTQTATSTLSAVQTVTVNPLEQYGVYAVPAVIIAAVALAFLELRRRSGKQPVKAAALPVPVAGKFCGDCGRAMPVQAKFCPGCGASTEDS